MVKNWLLLLLIFLFLFAGFSSVSATPTPPVKILSGLVSNVVSVVWKWLWSLQSTTAKLAVSSPSMMKFESGYTVETLFDGSMLGIEPYSVEVSPTGELLVLDSKNSNVYKISMPLSKYSRPKLFAGSPEGYAGHVDGKIRETRMYHPKGLTVDDKGNVYIADTMNMAIRKISDAGVTTIAGGKWGKGAGHVDGPSEDAKFSNDFDVIYIRSSCSILVVDRGNQAIREIQLNDEDCSYEYDGNFHLGIAVLVAAGFFGYMLALLQRRVRALFSSQHDLRAPTKKRMRMAPYQRPSKSIRSPLIQNEDEFKKPEESFFGSLGRLVLNTGSSMAEIFGGIFSVFIRKPLNYQTFEQQARMYSNGWPMQESFVIPNEDEPPPIETRTPTPQKTYPFMTKDIEKKHHAKQSHPYYNGWNGDHHQQQQLQRQHQLQMMQQQQQQQQQHHHHHHRHYSSNPQTHYEKSCEKNEIVFGAVQEQDGRREAVVIKAVDYVDPIYNRNNIRPRFNYMGYARGY